jgi:hypothetical protein
MALTKQTHAGDVDNANSYADVASMRAYYADRSVDLSPFSDVLLSKALVEATDFLDSRYAFIGTPLRALQGTACPRYLQDGTGRSFRDANTLEQAWALTTPQWAALTKACYQLAYRAVKKPNGLLPDPVLDATGRQAVKKSTKAGPIESTVEYAPGADVNIPSYPAVDLLLRNADLLMSRSGGTISRA